MHRLRRASRILARTEADGVPSDFAAEAQISERSTAAISGCVKTSVKPANSDETGDNSAARASYLRRRVQSFASTKSSTASCIALDNP